MLRIKQVEGLINELDSKVSITRIMETTDNISDPFWTFADDINIPTQLAVKEYVDSLIVSTGKIGIPTDGSYLDGYYDNWTEDTFISDAVDDLNEVVFELMPAKAENLTGKSLIGATVFSSRLSDNLPNLIYWTVDGLNPGDIIASTIDVTNITLTHPNTSTTFNAGSKKVYPNLIGSVYAWKSVNSTTFTTPINQRDLSNVTGGIGITGILQITDIAVYNQFHVKANAQINETSLTEGYTQYKLSSDTAGQTNTYKIYYTGSTFPSQTFSATPTSAELTQSIVKLSGVSYYGNASTFYVSYVADNLYSPVYAVNNQTVISANYFNSIIKNHVSIPNYNSVLTITNQVITIISGKTSNQSIGTGLVTLYKPNKTNVISSFILGNKPINSMGTVSTMQNETFYDENKRYYSYTSLTWDSNNVFSNTEEQLEVQNGRLIDPRFSGNYPSYTSTTSYYCRYFANRSINIDKGTLIITKSGTMPDVSPWLNSGGGKLQITMWVQRISGWKQYDLGLEVGLPDADGGIGIKDGSQSSNGIIKWAFISEYVKPSDIVIINIKFENTIATDYITELQMNWSW